MDELRETVQTHPVIDNHAHNLLKIHLQDDPKKLLSVTSEAQGEALKDSVHSLAHKSARQLLMQLYETNDDDWDSLMESRSKWLTRHEDLYRKCFEGTHAILVDDGLDADTVYPFDWHDQWTTGNSKRLVRIEVVAETIMREHILPNYNAEGTDYSDPHLNKTILEDFQRQFGKVIQAALEDDNVVGFKSVICYRSGLAVDLESSPFKNTPVQPFSEWLEECVTSRTSESPSGTVRLDSKPLNDWLVISTLIMISGFQRDGIHKPIQFHTGLGDNDIKLPLANPAHLQPLISNFPKVPIVLLHSSYPYTREAGYLATVYSNVFLDLGLVFPMISKSGQESVLTQALELTPYNKLLYSTDGHWFPETFYLASKQFRDALEQVLVQSVENGSLKVIEAVQAARDILFYNSNQLYNLKISLHKSSDRRIAVKPISLSRPEPLEPPATLTDVNRARFVFRQFLKEHPYLAFVYVQWFDYMGTMRVRVLPVDEFRRIAEGVTKIGISRGNTGSLQNDFLTPAVNTTGQIYVIPDLNSLKPTHRLDTLRSPGLAGELRTSATVMASWCDNDGHGLEACPRKQLFSIVDSIYRDYGIQVTLGFEIEVTFQDRTNDGKFVSPVTANHAWSTLSTEQWHGLGAIRDVYDGLRDIGVEVQQFHAESGKGQYEFILPPEPLELAIDTLLQARQVIRQIAYTRGLRATLLPSLGNGAHVHMSLNQADEGNKAANEWSFFAGVLEHLQAVCAFTLPEMVSYDRVVDYHWAGGTWVAWGTQNRECPLRRVKEGRWEFRALDGMANAYLALAGVMGAGLLGLREGKTMALADCAENPSNLTDQERAAKGIQKRMPRSLSESLSALREDHRLQEIVGKTLVKDYIVMKEIEKSMLEEMPEDARQQWLIERY